MPGFLNLNGSITSVSSALLETTATAPTIYDFSPFSSGGSIALTYNKVGADFADVIAHGGTITGTGGFTEVAVPEPGSMALRESAWRASSRPPVSQVRLLTGTADHGAPVTGSPGQFTAHARSVLELSPNR